MSRKNIGGRQSLVANDTPGEDVSRFYSFMPWSQHALWIGHLGISHPWRFYHGHSHPAWLANAQRHRESHRHLCPLHICILKWKAALSQHAVLKPGSLTPPKLFDWCRRKTFLQVSPRLHPPKIFAFFAAKNILLKVLRKRIYNIQVLFYV